MFGQRMVGRLCSLPEEVGSGCPRTKDANLDHGEIDRFLLLSIAPTGEDGEKQLPWREDEVHVVGLAVKRMSFYREAFCYGRQLSTPIAAAWRNAKRPIIRIAPSLRTHHSAEISGRK